jgi:hypothetical protein
VGSRQPAACRLLPCRPSLAAAEGLAWREAPWRRCDAAASLHPEALPRSCDSNSDGSAVVCTLGKSRRLAGRCNLFACTLGDRERFLRLQTVAITYAVHEMPLEPRMQTWYRAREACRSCLTCTRTTSFLAKTRTSCSINRSMRGMRRHHNRLPNLLRVSFKRRSSPKEKQPLNLTDPPALSCVPVAPPSGACDTLRAGSLAMAQQDRASTLVKLALN